MPTCPDTGGSLVLDKEEAVLEEAVLDVKTWNLVSTADGVKQDGVARC